jgi:hypothetical protein
MQNFKYKIIKNLGVVIFLMGVFFGPMAAVQADNRIAPIVVELFTSQGCSSCPPAEAYLAKLAKRDGIIALEFHVNYWDYIGWKDPFAKPAYTARQRLYGQSLDQKYVYTPEMVISGRMHEVGSRLPAIEMLLEDEANRLKVSSSPHIDLMINGSDLEIQITAIQNLSDTADIYLVGFDAQHETKVKRGENAGKTLISRNIVRSFSKLGNWGGQALKLSVPADLAKGDGGMVLLVQHKKGGPIIAAALLNYR